MPRKRKALTFAKHNVIEVFISREYLEELGIMDKVAYAMETENYSKVYEALITDAKNSDDFNFLKIVAGEHIIQANNNGITFVAT